MLQFDKDESDEGDTKVTNNSKANNSVIENNDESVQITELVILHKYLFNILQNSTRKNIEIVEKFSN